jgi:YD repeat-containing protein
VTRVRCAELSFGSSTPPHPSDGILNTHTAAIPCATDHDTLNRLTTLANSATGSFGFSYDALSRRTQLTRPNGIDTNYSYDSLSRLLSVLHQSGTSTIDGAAYTLDSAGNRTVKTDELANVTSNYTYDALYELTQVTQGSTTTESYSYDPVGNRTASLGVSSYTTNSSNELTADSNASFTYDNNGNTLTKTDSTGVPTRTALMRSSPFNNVM